MIKITMIKPRITMPTDKRQNVFQLQEIKPTFFNHSWINEGNILEKINFQITKKSCIVDILIL
jgi:hypothetical protein